MKTILMIGVIIVILALIFYSLGIFTEQRHKRIDKRVLSFLSLGLIFDISATACMIIGSTNSPFTFHGFIGYTGLLAMSIETFLAYQFYTKHGPNAKVSSALHWYSRLSYLLWVIVFITGSLLVR
jgi:uncharacterized repeat protein (TIGR03987 family)